MTSKMLVDIEVTTPTGRLFLNQAPYELASETLSTSQVTHRKQDVVNPFVEGTYSITSLRENLIVPISVWVRGQSHTEMAEAMKVLRAAFDQSTFSMRLMMEGWSEEYLCFASDYAITTQREFLHSKTAKLDVQLNHYPEPQSTGQASDGHSHSEYAPLDSPHLTGQPRAPVPLSTSNDDQISTTSFVKSQMGTAYVAKTGDTMSGPLAISTAAGAAAGLALNTAATKRWDVGKDASPESGADVGGQFAITAYSDTGIVKATPLTIRRTDGRVTVATDLYLSGQLVGQWGYFQGGADFNLQRLANVGTPLNPNDGANKSYVDTLPVLADTGWIQVEAAAGARNWISGLLSMRRIGPVVHMTLQNASVGAVEAGRGIYTLPEGFRATAPLVVPLWDEQSRALVHGVSRFALVLADLTQRGASHMLSGSWSYVTDDPFPEPTDG